MNAKEMNGATLAYLGDAVIELFVREEALMSGIGDVGRLNEAVTAKVRAKAQATAFDKMQPHLTEEEEDIFKRGRNAHVSVPKSATSAEYHKATGMEALFAFLYLENRRERIIELMKIGYGSDEGSDTGEEI